MLIAVCDSSFLSLPEVNDILLMTFSIRRPDLMPALATWTTVGSVFGCCLLYAVGRRGGERFLQRRFSGERLERVRRWYTRYGMLAVIVPSLLPPPTPFKAFVLSAGAFGITLPKFILAVTIGRGIRYFSEGFLAVWFGASAIAFVKSNFPVIGAVLAALIVAAAVIWSISRKRPRPQAAHLVLLVAATLAISGCVRRTVVPPSEMPLPAKTASRADLIQKLVDEGRVVRTISATITMDASGGAMKTGVLTEYSQMRGFLIVDRPGQIRIRGQAPLALATIFDMVSEGRDYKVWVPVRNKFIVGDNETVTTAENAILNLRPQHILEAMFVDVERYLADRRYRSVFEEALSGRLRYYVFEFIDISGEDGELVEKIWINRVDLSTARKQNFKKGVLETDVSFSSYQPVSGVAVPTIVHINRPIEDYYLKISLVKANVNEPVAADAFKLERPASAELVQVSGSPRPY